MENIDWTPDRANSISSVTGRLVVGGERTAQVRADASSKIQIAALMDLLDLHLSQVDVGEPLAPERVTLRVPNLRAEARGALGTLVQALSRAVHVTVLEGGTDGLPWRPATIGWNRSDVSEYSGWPELLTRPRPVPRTVREVLTAAHLPALRAYPMLSTQAGWSLRLEGLEVGRVSTKGVVLKVGKAGKNGGTSLQRDVWIEATGLKDPRVEKDPATAAHVIRAFAKAWQALGETSSEQDEHALESRILRGATPVVVNEQALSLIQPDPMVNWGSQFPTKWGPGGKPRYLDALLRNGSTPWAIEMKVRGGAGVGQYYRHAIAQAVLYREFIRGATPLHAWFDARGLEAAQCQGAVVIPRLTSNPKQAHWRDHLIRLCEAFEVAFVEVESDHARRH